MTESFELPCCPVCCIMLFFIYQSADSERMVVVDNSFNAEPYKIKMIEGIRMTSPIERQKLIQEAGYNVFNLRSDDVMIDLLTDSGTGAMSQEQWSALISGDESYAGSRSYFRLQEIVRMISGYEHVMPVHQGRAAENIFMQIMVRPGMLVPGNMHFDTTRGHLQLKGGIPLDLIIDEGLQPESDYPFKGNIDLVKLEKTLKEHGPEKIPFISITVTCNNNGGQPVSMANIRAARALSEKYGIPLFFDAARFAENCWFIRDREEGYADKTIREIARELFSYGDGFLMSAKKDGLVNIGGLLVFRDRKLYEQAAKLGIFYEGFTTYGGLAGRDLAALARGLEEVLDPDYLGWRISQVAYLAGRIKDKGVPIVEPPGGHAVYLDVRRFAPHMDLTTYPGQAIVIALYIEAGIRAVELGAGAFGEVDPETGKLLLPPLELVRLAIPRRVYTNSHMDVVADGIIRVFENSVSLQGLQVVEETPVMRHFTMRFAPLG
jgi:tryptophanase